MKLPARTVLLAALNVLTPIALAQDNGGKPAANIAGDLAGMNLEQLMKVQFSTASRHAQDESDTPSSVTILTREEIRTYGYRTLADALQHVRGFWINYDRNYSYLGVRGFARPGDYNSRFLLLVNGHRLNENVYDSALIGTEFPLDMDMVERIEIVRGPGSSLYGTSAMFAVINVITRQPAIAPALEASVEGAALHTAKARVTAGIPTILDGALLSASMYHSDGNHILYFPEFDSPATNNGIAEGVDGDSYASAFALVNWKHFELQGLIGSRTKVIPTASFGAIFNDPDNRTTDARGFVELSYKRDLVGGAELTSEFSYDGYLYRGIYAEVYESTNTLEHDGAQGEWVSNETQISSPFGSRNTVTAGMEFRYNLKQAQTLTAPGTTFPSLDITPRSSVFGLYGQDELRATSRLEVNAGLRFDHYSTFGSTVNPRIAAIFHADRRTVLKYSYGRAFRSPNVYEMYYADGITQEANPRLQPERIGSQELSAESALTPTFHVVAEAFYNALSDMVNAQIDPATGLYQFVNLNSSNSKGLEVEIDAQRKWASGQLSYTVQRSIDALTHGEPANSPQHVAKVNFKVPFPPALLLSLDSQFEAPQITFTNSRIPSFLIVNTAVSSQKPIWGFDIRASCTNLMNRHNYDPPSPAMAESSLLMDSRGFELQIVRRISRKQE